MVEGVDVENLHTQVLEQGFTGAFWFNGHAQVINLSQVTDIAFMDEGLKVCRGTPRQSKLKEES